MTTCPNYPRRKLTGLFLLTCSLSLTASIAYSQVDDEEEEVFELSPFEVTASDSTGYRATSSLAGTRIKTDLKDIASSISVVTKDFLRDTNSTDNQSLLTYTTNTEVGGVGGNFAGLGNTYIDGLNERFDSPNTNTRVRGLDSADNTRDYFLSDIPWDSYNVERVELQRGPNSILFGIGSPAGIINTSLNRANFGNENRVEVGFGSFGSNRVTVDMNRTLIEDELAFRISVLNENQKYRQKPAFEDDQRIFASLRWKPKFIQSDSTSTVARASFESGDIEANRPRVLPPQDRITPFFDANAIDRQTWDPYYAWVAGVIGYQGNTPIDPRGKNYWTVQYPGPGIQATSNPVFTFDGANATDPSSWMQAGATTNWGIDANGALDAGIGGFPYGSNIGIGSYNEFALNANNGGDPNYPAADKGFYKTKSLTDTSVFDYFNVLIDGPNKREWQNWDAFNFAFEQTFFNNKLGYEIVLDRQKYEDGQTRNLNGAYISVDIRENLMVYPWAFGDAVVKNPNAGRAFVGSGTKGTNSGRTTENKNDRITAYADIDFKDIAGDNALSGILGKHVFNAVYSETTYETENRDWVRYAVQDSWSDAYGNSNGGLVNGDVVLDWMTYLSGDLRGVSSARGLNLPGVTAVQNISGSFDIPYYNSTWNSTVDPGAFWNNPTTINDGSPESTQSENPFNYVGWTSSPFNILNADEGDIDQLYTGVGKNEVTTESKGIVWQGKLFNGLLVPTWGYREDTQSLREGNSTAAFEADGYAKRNPAYSDKLFTVSDSSTSWGAVLHTPEALAEKLPWDSTVSFSYNEGRNIRVQNRFGFGGEQLPNASGFTKDYGFVINALNDRLSFKTTYYETTVSNANISSVSSETATLGNNTYYLRNLEAWGTASALTNLMGRDVASNPEAYTEAENGIRGWNWYWNWALIDGNSVAGAEDFPGAWDGAYDDLSSDAYQNHPSTAKQTAAVNSWLAQMNDQSWFDAYGFAVDVAKVKAGDWAGGVEGWTGTAGVGGVQPAGGGRINGVWPTGTVDYVSKGVEYELIGNLTDNWSISVNASKTDAYQTALGTELSSYIEAAYEKYQSPAGDLRLWWGGDNTVRQYFDSNIWSAYQFQLQTNGKLAAELSPWSFNLVSNYNFNDGKLSGLNVGGGYRWKDGKILGYGLNEAKDNLDINKPFWSDTESHFDLWAGKDIELNDNITWRIQLNMRNVGENPELKPLSVQPDGSPGVYSIQEGMTWNLTNTFTF